MGNPNAHRARRGWRLSWILAGLATLVVVVAGGLGVRRPLEGPAPASGTADPLAPPLPPRLAGVRPHFAELPAAVVRVDSAGRGLVIELPPVDLPAGVTGGAPPMVEPPIVRAETPLDAYATSYRVEVVDANGTRLPQQVLHHFNLTEPDHRELFLPISLHMLAASRETPSVSVPGLVFGMPLSRGQRFLASAMLHNPTGVAYRGVQVRLVMTWSPVGRPWPLFRVYPWVMDVQFPLGRQPGGSKAFDLPPGRTVRSWESSPAVPGTILGMGGHLHDYGVGLELKDVTTGEVLGRAEPVRDSTGRVSSLPLVRFYRWYRLGRHVTPAHRYRVTVTYDNPTGHVIQDGGMGALAGLFVPDRGARWPGVDVRDTVYLQDLLDSMSPRTMGEMHMHGHGR